VSFSCEVTTTHSLPPEVLDHGLEVEHLLHVAGDELADLVHDEHQGLARTAAEDELQRPCGEIAGGDIGALHGGLAPAVHGRVGRGVERVHHAARLLDGDGDLPLLDVPLLAEDLAVFGLESVEVGVLLQGDLQLREVQVARVPEALQEEPVHDLRDALVAGADAPVGGDVEDDGLGGNALGDVAEQDLNPGIMAALGEELGGPVAQDVAVCQAKAEVLGEARLARAEEPGDPNGDALVRLLPRGLVVVEHLAEVGADRVGDDVFGQLVADDRLVGLIDLNDLFDAAVDVASEQVLDGFGCHGSTLRRSSAGSCARRPVRP
jgi:hypothetical protein